MANGGWFEDYETEAECKEAYKSLAKIMHPDKGGNPDSFNQLTTEYLEKLEELKKDGEPIPDEYATVVNALGTLLKARNPRLGEAASSLALFAPFAADFIKNDRKREKVKNFIGKINF